MKKRQQAYYRRLPFPSCITQATNNYLSFFLLLSICFSFYTLIFILTESQQMLLAQELEIKTGLPTTLAIAPTISVINPIISIANHTTLNTTKIIYPLKQTITQFIQGYFNAISNNDINNLMIYYDDQVNYYDWGLVEKEMIKQEKLDYFERWPIIEQSLLGNLDIFEKNNITIVEYYLNFAVFNPTVQNGKKNYIKGEAKHTWHLITDKTGKLKISLEHQQVTKRIYDDKSIKNLH